MTDTDEGSVSTKKIHVQALDYTKPHYFFFAD